MDKSLNTKSLDFDRLKLVLQDLANHRVLLVGVAGGDPLLYPHFDELIEEIVSLKMMPIATLSGQELSRDRCFHLSSLGLRSVQLSLDGDRQSTHDFLRGPGSFFETIDSVRHLSEAGIAVSLAVCLHSENADELFGLTKLAHNLGVRKIKVQRWKKSGATQDGGLTELDWEKFERLSLHPKENFSFYGEIVFERRLRRKGIPRSLAILASGAMVLSEFEKPIGHIEDQLPSELFRSGVYCG